MADLPLTPDPTRDGILVLIALYEDGIPYSVKNGGNVVVRGAYDTEEAIQDPSVVLFHALQTVMPGGADGVQDRVDESIQVDVFSSSEGGVNNLKYLIEAINLANRVDPGGAGANIFAFLLPEQWVNNDAINQAEGFHRRTVTVNLIRHRGINV